jgi:hypothetical protein
MVRNRKVEREPLRWTPTRFAFATFAASGVWFIAWKLLDMYAI